MSTTSSWDAIVVGAGPAGSVAAYLLAREGLQMLLTEAKKFPRGKVCGGCLNPRAINALDSIGLGPTLRSCGGEHFDRVRLFHHRQVAEVPLPSGISVTRRRLDAALVEQAIAAGATFVTEAKCKVLPAVEQGIRTVEWQGDGQLHRATAPMVLACDGLGHPSLSEIPACNSVVATNSHIGLGVIVEQSEATECIHRHSIFMVVSDSGYVGVTRAEENCLSVAAAINPASLGSSNSPASVLEQMLRSAGIEQVLAGASAPVRGTLPITQQATSVAAERLLLVGDAAGYVEPFTGEGMAAAIEGALLVAPIAKQAARAWQPKLADQWQSEYARRVRSRQVACRSIAWLVRHPRVLGWSLRALALQPGIGSTVGRWIGRSTH